MAVSPAVAPAAMIIPEKASPAPAEPHAKPSSLEVQAAFGSLSQPDSLELDLFGDHDDAQSFIQPAISPVATRLTSPKTPAAEKAAAMDRVPGGGLFDVLDEQEPSPSQPSPGTFGRPTEPPHDRVLTGLQPAQQLQQSPHASSTVWPFGGDSALPAKNSVSGASGTQPGQRHQRSSSISENAFRRLSKALPSISLPQGFMQNLHAPNFLASSSFQKEELPASPPKSAGPPGFTQSQPRPSEELQQVTAQGLMVQKNGAVASLTSRNQGTLRPPSVTSGRSYTLRRSGSNDSLLYHSLSRVSSLGDGDEERFAHIREQVNSRLKAIKDSWDGPTFKFPQLPNILSSPLWRSPMAETSPDAARPGAVMPGARGSKDPVSTMDAVLESLTGDVVIMGGYRGSILRSAQPPFQQLWVPIKVGLNMRKVNLEVGLDPQDEETMEERIFASGMLQSIGPVDISKRLFKKLRESPNARTGKLRIHDYGYDWRLSPHLLSRKLVDYLAKLPSNQPDTPRQQRGALVIAHSLGGLITRHAVNQRPDLFSGVIYVGTPQRCINILGPMRNGDAVLLNEKVLTAQVNFSLRTSFVFLPEDGFCFMDKTTGEEYPIDFYNVQDWIKYRLSPCVSEPVLPPLLPRSSTFGSLLSLPDSISNIPLRARSNSQAKKEKVPIAQTSHAVHDVTRRVEDVVAKDRTLAPQMGASSSFLTQNQQQGRDQHSPIQPPAAQARNVAYLARVLAETKRFRAELAHNPAHEAANAYPPLAVIYGKDIPTVCAARVAGRDGIMCADAYDDLVFRGGDGVALARESMLPPGYELVRGGRVCTDRGHVTMLGDLAAVGRALEAVVRGRRKGIGLGGERPEKTAS